MKDHFIADANALIYLAKIGLLGQFCKTDNVTIPSGVKKECLPTQKERHQETQIIEQLIAQKKLCVLEPKAPLLHTLKLGTGETEVIALAEDFPDARILTDDKKTVNWLKKNQYDFISSPLVPVLLAQKKVIEKDSAEEYIHQLNIIGYFSPYVINYALQALSSNNNV